MKRVSFSEVFTMTRELLKPAAISSSELVEATTWINANRDID